jgi:pyridoxamine 5'-phosphate oxidase
MKTKEITLSGVWKTIEGELKKAVNDRNHAFKLPVISTINGNQPNLRTVVLRNAETEPLTLTFYTDSRSQKVEELKSNRNLTWLFWDAETQTQVKVVSQAKMEQGTRRNQEIWESMHIGSRAAYLTRSAPSTAQTMSSNGLPLDFFEKELEQNNEYFTIVDCIVSEVEWLQLSRGNNLRARFSIDKEKEMIATWLVP